MARYEAIDTQDFEKRIQQLEEGSDVGFFNDAAGDGVTNDRGAFQDHADNYAPGDALDLDGKTYRIDDFIDYSSHSNLTIQNGTIDFSHAPGRASNTNFMMRFSGSIAATGTALAANFTASHSYPPNLTVVPGGGVLFASNDMVLISSTGIFNDAGGTLGEINFVHHVTGDVLEMKFPAKYNYLVSDTAVIKKITPVQRLRFKNVHFLGAAPITDFPGSLEQPCFTITYGRDIVFEDCRFENFTQSIVKAITCWKLRFINCSVENIVQSWYGVLCDSGCRNIVVSGNDFLNVRHGYTTGTSGIPSVDAVISNNWIAGTQACIDTHPGADSHVFAYNHVYQQGKDAFYAAIHNEGHSCAFIGNVIRGYANAGISNQWGGKMVDQPATIVVRGNDISLMSDVAPVNGISVISRIDETDIMPDRIVIEGNTVKGAFSNAGIIVQTSGTGGTQTLKGVVINGNTITGALNSCITLRADGNDIDGAVITGNMCNPGGVAVEEAIQLRPATGRTISHVLVGGNSGINLSTGIIKISTGAVMNCRFGNNIFGATNQISGFATTDRFETDFTNAWRIFASSGVAVSVAGTTVATTLADVTIPAGLLGPNGRMRITTMWSHTNSANTKTLRVRHGPTASGTAFATISATTTATTRLVTDILNRNDPASQVGWVIDNGAYGSSTSAVVTAATNTASASHVAITGQLSTVGSGAGESITLEGYLVEINSQF